MFLNFCILAFGILSMAQAIMVQPEQIAQTVNLNDTTFVAYNSSTVKCRIDCADAETMLQKEVFRSFQKVWMFNNTEMFSAFDKTFIDSNSSLEFQVLTEEDSGTYQCCIRSTDLAYQSFVCYSTLLIVVDEMPDGLNATAPTTEAPPMPSWNVLVENGDTVNCLSENNYFLKVFEENVTAIHCLVNEVEINIKTSNSFTFPLYNDILIKSFNVSDHSGLYECNGTLQVGNETTIETVRFTVTASEAENKNADLLDPKIAAEALKGAVAVLSTFLIHLFVLLSVFGF